MKKIIILLFTFGFLFSCSENPIEQPINPFADSTNIKFELEIYSFDAIIPNSKIGDLVLLNFDGIIKRFDIHIIDPHKRNSLKYVYVGEIKKDSIFIDSLDKIFIIFGFKNYPDEIPYNRDTSEIPLFPCNGGNIHYKSRKNEILKRVEINGCFKSGIFPEKFDEFYANVLSLTYYK